MDKQLMEAIMNGQIDIKDLPGILAALSNPNNPSLKLAKLVEMAIHLGQSRFTCLESIASIKQGDFTDAEKAELQEMINALPVDNKEPIKALEEAQMKMEENFQKSYDELGRSLNVHVDEAMQHGIKLGFEQAKKGLTEPDLSVTAGIIEDDSDDQGDEDPLDPFKDIPAIWENKKNGEGQN